MAIQITKQLRVVISARKQTRCSGGQYTGDQIWFLEAKSELNAEKKLAMGVLFKKREH